MTDDEELDLELAAYMRKWFTPKQAARIKWEAMRVRDLADEESRLLSDPVFENDPGHQWFLYCLDSVARMPNA